MKIKRVTMNVCEACLDGRGSECHTPSCALFMHDSLGFPIMPELYEVLEEWEEPDTMCLVGGRKEKR